MRARQRRWTAQLASGLNVGAMPTSPENHAPSANEGLLAGQSIAVTGATRGLGRAFARALAAAGASLVVNGRDVQELDALVTEIAAAGASAVAVPGSVAQEQTAERIVAAAVERFGKLDPLVNNAGVVRDRTTLRMSVEEFDEVIATNLRGSWLCGREAARAMKRSGGHIINITSNAAFQGSVGQSNYAAAKAGVAALTRAWAFELDRYGIRANAVWPIALTDMTEVVVERAGAAAEADGRERPSAAELGFGDPEAVATLVVYLASDLASHLNHQIVTFNGGRIATWTHPREEDVRERPRWSVGQIAEHFSGPQAVSQQPLYEPQLAPLLDAQRN
ncbi:MAG: 3-oxoacyl-ACP reductase [Solirubrobacterales bacterium]|nr:3-oxoacyl-ACP reductase [Solirubrobacterales bacterium]